MLHQTIARSLVATALLATPALAQGPAAPDVTSPGKLMTVVAPAAAGPLVTEQKPDQWRASKLIGVDATRRRRQEDRRHAKSCSTAGATQAVVIGVGGFLGMGQKDVAVPFQSLQWTNEPLPPVASGEPMPAPRPPRTDTTGSLADPPATPRLDPAMAEARRGYPDRAVLAMTKAELEKAPAFHYMADRGDRTGSDAVPSAAPVAPPKQ